MRVKNVTMFHNRIHTVCRKYYIVKYCHKNNLLPCRELSLWVQEMVKLVSWRLQRPVWNCV